MSIPHPTDKTVQSLIGKDIKVRASVRRTGQSLPCGVYPATFSHAASDGLGWFTPDGKYFDSLKMQSDGTYSVIAHTEQMRNHLGQMLSCNYCGKVTMRRDADHGYCNKCMGSEHLGENELHLLRLRPSIGPRNHLEREDVPQHVVAMYRAEQAAALAARTTKRIAEARRYRDRMVRDAAARCNVTLAVLRSIPRYHNNEILYDHTSSVCIGWYKPVDEARLDSVKPLVKLMPGLHKKHGIRRLYVKTNQGDRTLWEANNPEKAQ